MRIHTDDVRIANVRPLLPAAILMEELPITKKAEASVFSARKDLANCVAGADHRLVVVTGPCSIHDENSAFEYATRLREESNRFADDLVLVMRTYFEKPRTTVGWKGLINDPDMDGSFRVNEGLRKARRILVHIAQTGVPCAAEFLDTTLPQHYADLIAWGAIGARTSPSQLHREMASGLSMPVGFKNGIDGSVRVAIDAIFAAKHSHWFAGATKDGISALIQTKGNSDCHLILRGGDSGPNFDAASIALAAEGLETQGLPHRVLVDCSHANSSKDYRRQGSVAESVCESIREGLPVLGIMIESHLKEGRQEGGPLDSLQYGVSVTDSCINWETTTEIFEKLALANRARTASKSNPNRS